MMECEVVENCKNYGKCELCSDYELYWPEKQSIKCKRQIENAEKRKIQKKMQKDSEASKRGKRAKRKGYAGENEIVHLLEKYNIPAKRIPLSGALKGELGGDIKCTVNGEDKKIESKRRADGFKELYKYIEQDGCEFIFMRADRKGWLVAMTFEEWLRMVK